MLSDFGRELHEFLQTYLVLAHIRLLSRPRLLLGEMLKENVGTQRLHYFDTPRGAVTSGQVLFRAGSRSWYERRARSAQQAPLGNIDIDQ